MGTVTSGEGQSQSVGPLQEAAKERSTPASLCNLPSVLCWCSPLAKPKCKQKEKKLSMWPFQVSLLGARTVRRWRKSGSGGEQRQCPEQRFLTVEKSLGI